MFLETVREKLLDPLLWWVGYVPAEELVAAQGELLDALIQVTQLEEKTENQASELWAMESTLRDHKALLATRLSKMAEHLAPLASVRRDPREMQRYALQVVIELDVLERMLFDYQIKGDSVDCEFLLDGLFHRLRNDFSVLLRLQKIKN